MMPSLDLCALTHKNANVHNARLEIDLDVFHTCSMRPCRAFYECVFFFAGMGDPSKPKYQKKYKKNNIWQAEKRNKTLGGGTLSACAKIQGISLKNGVDMEL